MFIEEFFPNYHKLYPNVEISEELYKALRQSDQKIKYMEYDLKHGKATYVNSVTGKTTDKDDPFAEIEGIISLDMLLRWAKRLQFSSSIPTTILKKFTLKKSELRSCIAVYHY